MKAREKQFGEDKEGLNIKTLKCSRAKVLDSYPVKIKVGKEGRKEEIYASS